MEKAKSLNELAKRIHADQVEKGFYKDERQIGTLLMLIVSELSEALEADRKGRHVDLSMKHPVMDLVDLKDKKTFEELVKDTFEDEIADAMIRLLDLCGYLGIDIEKHIELKNEYNRKRMPKHGKQY